jgi:glycosyltransferase involved in cell wall biosynthesis
LSITTTEDAPEGVPKGPPDGPQGDAATAAKQGRGFVAKAFGVTALFSAVGSVLGLLRDLLLARYYGAGSAPDAFLVSWTVPETAAPLLIEDGMALLTVPAFSAALAARGQVEAERVDAPDPVRALVAATPPPLALALMSGLVALGALGLPAHAFVVGAVGRLVPGKRFDVLVDALALLPPEAHLLIVGTGPEHDTLLAQARERGVAERVVLTGERDDVPALLATMDALAAPSAGETFGLVLVEGLASGLPVFWSSGPALAELPVQEQLALGRGGSARTEPTPSAYAAAVGSLLTRRPPRTIGPVPGRYDITHLAPRVAAVYAELAGVVEFTPSTAAAEAPAARHRTAPPKEMTRAR